MGNPPRAKRRCVAFAFAALALSPLPFAIASCVAAERREPYVLDCDAGAPYDLHVSESYEVGDPTNPAPWYSAGDFTAGAAITAATAAGSIPVTRIEGSGRCGSQYALLLESHGFHDWGSVFGDYRIGGFTTPIPLDASQYEGVSFWARDPGYTSFYEGPTTKSVAVNLLDVHGTPGGDCTNYIFDSGGAMSVPVNVANGSTPTGSAPASGLVFPADACNNAQFTVPIVLSDEWRLYAIPFSAFTQMSLPNREPNGLDRAALMSFTVTVPKEAQLELWIDDFGFYRTKSEDGGTAEGAP